MDAPESRPERLPREEFERIRSQILSSLLAELTELRRRGDDAYGYTKSDNENYGKYEKQ
jgi:hypothetical protein